MSAPKHLWSGDWQRESAAVSDELVKNRAQPRDSEATLPPTPPIPTPAPWAAPASLFAATTTPRPAPRTPDAASPTPRAAPPAPQAAPRMPRAAPPTPRAAPPAPRAVPRTPGAAPAPRTRPRWQPFLPVVLAALLVLAAGAYGLTALLGSSGHAAQPTQSPPAAGSPSSPASGPAGPVNWLGMQIETLPPGVVVVETVAPGSPAELAGLEPGDVIVAINNRRINVSGDISQAISGLGAGDEVQLEISRGSALFTTQAILAAPPSGYP